MKNAFQLPFLSDGSHSLLWSLSLVFTLFAFLAILVTSMQHW